MKPLPVRIEHLPPMRVASLWGFGPQPEDIAWRKLTQWAGARGLLADPEAHPIFGFNNPNPSAGSPNYGYEVWIVVDADVEAADDVRLVDFDGGLYAVARCEIPEGQFDVIGETWRRLVVWREDSAYKCAGHQWLEKTVPHRRPGIQMVLDLYLPIAQ